MKIKVTTSCSGLTFSFAEGQTVDVERKIGEDLIRCGFAEEVKAPKTEVKRKTAKAEPEEKSEDSDGADA